MRAFVFLIAASTISLVGAIPALAQLGGSNQLFLGNFGVSTVGLSPLARQELVNLLNLELANYARQAALGNLALQLEKRRLSPILNCQAPAASSQGFAFDAPSCRLP